MHLHLFTKIAAWLGLALRLAGWTLGAVLCCGLPGCADQPPRRGPASAQVVPDGPAAQSALVPPEPAEAVRPPGALAADTEVSASPEIAVQPPRDLWDRMRRGFQLKSVESPLVPMHLKRFRDARYFAGRIERIRLFMPLIVAEIEGRGLPMELAMVPLVESALNCNARSVVAASGAGSSCPVSKYE